MWCIIVFAAIGPIIGLVFDIIDGEPGNIAPLSIVGTIIGCIITIIISIGTWIFVPEDGYQLTNTDTYMLAANENGELRYFNISHDENTTYLYYLDENNEMQRLYLSTTEVYFIDSDEPARVEKYKWRFKSEILRAIAFKPLTRLNSTTRIYIPETEWARNTDGGVIDVVPVINEEQ